MYLVFKIKVFFTTSLNSISLSEVITAKLGVFPFNYSSMHYVYKHIFLKRWSYYVYCLWLFIFFASYIRTTTYRATSFLKSYIVSQRGDIIHLWFYVYYFLTGGVPSDLITPDSHNEVNNLSCLHRIVVWGSNCME